MHNATVLVMNMGSSSLKWVVLDADTEAIAAAGGRALARANGGRHADELSARTARACRTCRPVGHRVVHGGTMFREPVLVDDRVRDGIASWRSWRRCTIRPRSSGIDAATAALPERPTCRRL